MKRLFVLVACLLLAGCADELDQGIVTGKEHTPASDSMIWMPGTAPVCGKYGCSGGTPGYFMPTHQDEQFVLHLKDGDRTGDHDVEENEYNKYQIGQRYP